MLTCTLHMSPISSQTRLGKAYPDTTRLDSVRHADGTVEILGEDVRCETEFSIVTLLDHFLLCLEFDQGAHGAEDLLASKLHVKVHIGDDGWLDEEPFISVPLAP